jgi:hypothetical protein
MYIFLNGGVGDPAVVTAEYSSAFRSPRCIPAGQQGSYVNSCSLGITRSPVFELCGAIPWVEAPAALNASAQEQCSASVVGEINRL